MSIFSDHLFRFRARHSANRLAAPLNLPTYFVELLFLIEDKRFGIHPGIDPVAMIRATINNLTGGRLQGASTITQQLYDVLQARNRIDYRRERTIRRKAHQITWACLTELHQRKDQILRDYLNNVYWGRTYFGLAAASHGYFRSDARSLSVAESFFLTERLANPNSYFPSRVNSLLARPPIITLMARDKSSVDQLRKMYSAWS